MTVLPGPSAVETALVASGLAGDQYRFLGYLPRTRAGACGALAGARARGRIPTVAFESPKRLPATLASLAAADPDRPVAVCRELTKLHEEVVCGTAASLAERFREPPKGEVTLVIGAGDDAGPETDAVRAAAAVAAWPSSSRPGAAAQRRCGRRRAAHGGRRATRSTTALCRLFDNVRGRPAILVLSTLSF